MGQLGANPKPILQLLSRRRHQVTGKTSLWLNRLGLRLIPVEMQQKCRVLRLTARARGLLLWLALM